MSQKKNHISQYLNSHSQGIDGQLLSDCLTRAEVKAWNNVVILPVCGETSNNFHQVYHQVKNESFLVIVCVNRPANHDKSNLWQQQNQQLVDNLIQDAGQVIEVEQAHKLLLDVDGLDCLLLDFSEQPFEDNKGVGLARKKAADTALHLIDQGWITRPWIFGTDADVILPSTYVQTIEDVRVNVSALSLKFKHCGEDEEALLYQAQYDFKLHYYQQCVAVINPMYAYIPLGSTLVIQAKAYAKVRGFPARSGGEDFYILNKLAKVGKVVQPSDPVIDINIRYSDRVPFGTGPAISQLAATQQSLKYYHPEIFFVLKKWRAGLLNFFNHNKLPENDHNLNQYWQVERVLDKAIKQYKTEKQWCKFIDDWFDAFRILKSVHFLQLQFPPVSQTELLSMRQYQEMSNQIVR